METTTVGYIGVILGLYKDTRTLKTCSLRLRQMTRNRKMPDEPNESSFQVLNPEP